MKNRVKKIAGACMAAAALLVAGGGYYYFHVHTDTPDVAMKTLAKSIERHDLKEFHRVVNVDSVLDSGYDGFVAGLTSAETPTDSDESMKNFLQILRAPMMLSLKAALDSYIATGELKAQGTDGVRELLERTGLNDIEIRDVKNIQVNDANRNEAFADIIVFQPELEREFPIQFILNRGDDNQWQVARVQNFQEYVEQIMQARRTQLDEYLATISEINTSHEASLREAEQKYGMILSLGNLAQDKTRADLKNILLDVYKRDWEQRKQELFGLHVPKDAETLHNLYIKICDLSIASTQDYANWMDDKNAMTIKSAEDKFHQAQTLMTEATALARRMAG